MAIITNEQFKTDVYSRDVQLPDLPSDATFFSLLKRAITNVRFSLKSFEPQVFEVWLEDQTSPVTMPDDFVDGETVLFFKKDEYELPIGGQYLSKRNSKWYVESHDNFSIKYQKDIPRQTSLGANFPFKTEKAQEILISEMMALINSAFEENEATAAVTNSLTQSNRIQ